MPLPIISVENLSKRYLVGHREDRRGAPFQYTALRDTLGRELRNAARKAVDVVRGRQVVEGDSVEEFWALKDVSFEVNEGEVLGIIGKNGAGKSTLLKILSRIIEPTAGRVTLRGRVASLLEVGTGFHPELTGRENIYLNGAILGMTRVEIRRKFDEIVAFAEVEKFLDTPVKRYSSGMYVRLAFAVAAHLEPEILIVDEVLAVGDAEFQKKCLGKMNDVSRREGRTVLFVSHNLSAIAGLAGRGLLMKDGAVLIDGTVDRAIAGHLSQGVTDSVYVAPEQRAVPYVSRAEITTSRSGGLQIPGAPLDIKIWIAHPKGNLAGMLGVQIVNQFQISATHVGAYPPDYKFGAEPGVTLIEFHIPHIKLYRGRFHLRINLMEQQGNVICEMIDGICSFEVMPGGFRSDWPADAFVYQDDFSVNVKLGYNEQTPARDFGDNFWLLEDAR